MAWNLPVNLLSRRLQFQVRPGTPRGYKRRGCIDARVPVSLFPLPGFPTPTMSTAGGETVDTPFDFDVRLGIVFIIEFASLSAIAVASLLVYIAVCYFISEQT